MQSVVTGCSAKRPAPRVKVVGGLGAKPPVRARARRCGAKRSSALHLTLNGSIVTRIFPQSFKAFQRSSSFSNFWIIGIVKGHADAKSLQLLPSTRAIFSCHCVVNA